MASTVQETEISVVGTKMAESGFDTLMITLTELSFCGTALKLFLVNHETWWPFGLYFRGEI